MAGKKFCVDKNFPGTYEGILRLLSLALGGGIFGTIANNAMTARPSAHALMWVAIFAWIIGVVLYSARLFNKSLSSDASEWKLNLIFTVLYLVTAIIYGVFDLVDSNENLYYGGLGILIFVFAVLNFFVYLDLTIVQARKSCNWEWSKMKSPKKDKDAEAGVDHESEAKDDNENEEKLTENAKTDEEPEAEQTEQKADD